MNFNIKAKIYSVTIKNRVINFVSKSKPKINFTAKVKKYNIQTKEKS